MIEQVNSLIRNRLCQNESIYMPRIGSLIFSHIAAKQISAKRIVPPHNCITFSGEERGTSLVDIIASIAVIPTDRAESIYEQWRQQTTRNGVVTITGVGTIKDRIFTPEDEFAKLLNISQTNEAVKLYPRTNYLFYAIATISILFAIGSAYYVVKSESAFSQRMGKEGLKDHQASTVTTTTPISEAEPTPSEEAVQSQNEATTAKPAIEAAITPIDMTPNTSYAVWGVYGELSNAERYVKVLHDTYNNPSARIYNYKGRYMVGIASGNTRQEAASKVAELKKANAKFSEVWIYTNK